ncbi:MAG: O-methyltransferase [Pseudomonadota bacterium]|nr:O-methyltransferase [Pseudomonadota bacterium]
MSASTIRMTDRLDAYLVSVSDREPAILAELRAETRPMKGAGMQITPLQGQFMALLVKLVGPRRIVEVGTFTGYSSLAMGLAMAPDARMTCLDISEDWTAIARRYWAKAGLADRIDLVLGPAAASMERLLAADGPGTVDMVFIDADKENYATYWEHALALLRPGGLVLVDNVLFQSNVPEDISDADILARYPDSPDFARNVMIPSVHAIRAFNRAVHADDRVELSMLPVGDGLTLAVKR